MIRYASLGSGSSGNGTLIACDDQLILLDCGFTIKEVERRMARLGYSPLDLTAVVVTHEHGDHIKGVGPLARKYGLPVYMTRGTWHSRAQKSLDHLHLIEGYQPFQLGNVLVTPVAVPHDAREPAQFIFNYRNRCLGILTDLGSISAHVEAHYEACDALVLEANHDPHMLASGSYPPSLKRRVAGAWGHLSNQQAEGFLQRVERAKLQQLVVAHISRQNNSLDIASACLSSVSETIGTVIYACQDDGFDWLEIV